MTAKRRRVAQRKKSPIFFHQDKDESDGDFDVNLEDSETDDSSSDGFDEAFEVGKSSMKVTRTLGPPITVDEKMEKLDEIHRMVVDDFVVEAKKIGRNVRNCYESCSLLY